MLGVFFLFFFCSFRCGSSAPNSSGSSVEPLEWVYNGWKCQEAEECGSRLRDWEDGEGLGERCALWAKTAALGVFSHQSISLSSHPSRFLVHSGLDLSLTLSLSLPTSSSFHLFFSFLLKPPPPQPPYSTRFIINQLSLFHSAASTRECVIHLYNRLSNIIRFRGYDKNSSHALNI